MLWIRAAGACDIRLPSHRLKKCRTPLMVWFRPWFYIHHMREKDLCEEEGTNYEIN